MTHNSDAEIEKIMTEGDDLLRRRLSARGLEAVHIIFAVTPDSTGVVRTNAGPDALRKLAETLWDIARHLQVQP
jgi:hypothetical protein